ncbi:hypothetical protein GCM10027579_27950 [Calidifontibacter terrae]
MLQQKGSPDRDDEKNQEARGRHATKVVNKPPTSVDMCGVSAKSLCAKAPQPVHDPFAGQIFDGEREAEVVAPGSVDV